MLSFLTSKLAPTAQRSVDQRTKTLIKIGVTVVAMGGVLYSVYRRWNRPQLESALLANPFHHDIDSLGNHFAGLALDPATPPSRIAQHYQDHIKAMSTMIISGAHTYNQAPAPHWRYPSLANLEGYSETHKPEWGTKATALSVEYDGKLYPIGYKIFLPNAISQASNVIVSVYGGDKDTDKEDSIKRPARSGFTKWGVSQICPVIELFLPDLLQPYNQFAMSLDLHTILHRCIHHFFEKIREPQSLDPLLERYGFNKANYFLMGSSFGGGLVVRHSQLYPHTFKGYISHDGGLVPLNDMPIMPNQPRVYANADTLYPLSHVADCEDTMLFLQNVDDNNVNRDNVLRFYDALRSGGKAHLAKICFFNKGSVASADELWNKGHGLPSDMQRYVKAISDFIEDPQIVPELNELIFTRKKMVAQECFINDSKERFLAMACYLFMNNSLEQQTDYYENWQNFWADICEPMLWSMLEIKELIANETLYREKIQMLQSKKLLSKEVIQNAVKQHAPMFQELYRELNNGAEISTRDIIEDPHILKTYTELLLDHYTDDFTKNVVLESLYVGNPQLMPTHISAEWKKMALEYKQEFKRRIDEYKDVLNNASQAIKAASPIVAAYQSASTTSVRLLVSQMNSPMDYFYVERPGH